MAYNIRMRYKGRCGWFGCRCVCGGGRCVNASGTESRGRLVEAEKSACSLGKQRVSSR